MDNPAMDPPPPYVDGNGAPVANTVPPQDPPPKYEPPKYGPYATENTAPPPQSGSAQPVYPVQIQPGYGATVSQTIIITDVGFGAEPRTLECVYCHDMITTKTSYVNGGLAFLTSGLICLFGCWLGCCLIPFCIPELQDVRHYCPNCGKYLGTYHRL